MKVDGSLLFAPNIRFEEVDWDGPLLPRQFQDRMEGFYLNPAMVCTDNHHAFAAGVLLVACIDAIAHLKIGRNSVGKRFTTFASELVSFSSDGLAKRLYEDFRNGLVHEGRIKRGCQFSLELETTVYEEDGHLIINPLHLAGEVRQALNDYVSVLEKNADALSKLADRLREDLAKDIEPAGRWSPEESVERQQRPRPRSLGVADSGTSDTARQTTEEWAVPRPFS